MAKTRTPKKPVRRRTGPPKAPARTPPADPPGEPPAEDANGVEPVVIRIPGRDICRVQPGRRLQRTAMEWTYVLRNRRGWTSTTPRADGQGLRARRALEALGVNEDALTQIAAAGVAEVEAVYQSEKQGWEARILPWEHLLAAATRPLRDGRALTVVRRLKSAHGAHGVRAPQKVLYVESAPCGLRGSDYSFDGEERLVRLAFTGEGQAAPIAVHTIKDPTRAELRQHVAQFEPDVVHLAGFDAHQATDLLPELNESARAGQTTAPDRVADGYLLRLDNGRADLVGAEDLAGILTAGQTRPSLVSFNIYNSAARLAALVVAAGAGAAIGYQDDFSDRLSEVFYERLYWAWSEDREDLLPAFRYAWSEVRQRGEDLGGTGIVLWGRASWFDRLRSAEGPAQLAERGTQDRNRILPVPPAERPQELMTADVKPHDSLNYSILHNSKEQSIFERFIIVKPRGRVSDVRVSVSLQLGGEEGRFELTSTIDDPLWSDTPVDLARLISMPLISPRLRDLRDSTKTLITVLVTWGPHVVYHRTHQVTLLAIDEWRDDDANRVWLPSFILPGDPAVRRVVDAAQRYLVVLADDPSAGFDGYQSGDPDAVDMQVQAIWSAIVQDFGLAYINPPPGGAESSQRVRTPSGVIEARHGTCIDLALLFAACLEYIDVYPAMFLLTGHAFPAYWRTEAAHEKFERLSPGDVVASALGRASEGARLGSGGGASGKRRRQWAAEKWAYPWLVQRVRSGDLVPLETVFLTSHTSFDEAVKEGAANLSAPREFDSIQDVAIARRFEVTPLPLHSGGR